jgi:serine protease Do
MSPNSNNRHRKQKGPAPRARSVLLALIMLATAAMPALAPRSAHAQQPQHEKVGPFEPPRTVAPLARALSKAVVNISTLHRRRAPVISPHGPKGPFDEDFRKFFERRGERKTPSPHRGRRPAALGSGFIIDPKGIVVTNNHVIEGADEIFVVLQDGTRLKARLRGRDPKTDLAVLEVSSEKPLPYVVFGDSDTAEVGDWVMAIGNPFGLGGSVTLGIISARNRDINAGPYDDFIQTDAAINKGNSGGPLFNMRGEVIGVNSAILSPTGGSVGIGFSIPSNLARKVVAQLIEFGETRRGWLGVRIQTITEDLAAGLGLDRPRGALVADVTKGGPADKAGIKPRDVIIAFDGVEIKRMRDLPRIVAETPVGKEVVVRILRDGREMEVKVTLGRLEEGEKLMAAQEKAEKEKAAETELLGMKLAPLDETRRKALKIPDKVREGVVVLDVTPGSDAEKKGLAPGDVITEAGGRKVTTPKDIAARVEAYRRKGRKAIEMLLLRKASDYEPRFVAIWIAKDRQ